MTELEPSDLRTYRSRGRPSEDAAHGMDLAPHTGHCSGSPDEPHTHVFDAETGDSLR